MSRRSQHTVSRWADCLQSRFNVDATSITGSKYLQTCQQWLEHFCPDVKRNTGHWVYRGFRWHAWSFGHEKAISGMAAVDAYLARPVMPFYVYLEFCDLLFDCTAAAWPDLRPLDKDIYVFPHRMNWTFVTTHEMSMDLGPWFATRPV